MFFILSKALSYFLNPFIWILILLFIFLRTKDRFKKRRRGIFAFVILITFTNPWIVNKVNSAWEVTPVLQLTESYELAIVLTGMTDPENRFKERIQLNSNVERFIEPMRLYHNGTISKILITGGSQYELKEADALGQLAIQLKVNEKDLIIESEALNTYENAKFAAEIVRKDFPEARILLITSADHMRRASACFRKQNLNFTPYPVDFNSYEEKLSFQGLLPALEPLVLWENLFHEMFGYIAYKTVGYL